ncbi:hypothetical protein JRO89_XS01G0223900 [Xanthoceras sorbifolium]|uniref:Ribosomal protein L13 n=1 Tax=Xanthoceras sorbifolium TaxID=99658 RepID=A0ABQ8ILK7_9ROSI|nr:hypothetical protein JRO89_XS01G0223900 [Xanthoceras sorbifolium]
MQKALAGLRRINLEGLRWRVFDAKGQVLGRLASQIATVVQGKDKPTYTPNREEGDMCIVLNAKEVCVTGRKLTDKFYRWHTGQVLLFLAVFSCEPNVSGFDFKFAGFLILLDFFICFLKLELVVSHRYIGHLKERSLKDQLTKDPTEVIRKAVLRMLPRNKLRDVSIISVKLYLHEVPSSQTPPHNQTKHTISLCALVASSSS